MKIRTAAVAALAAALAVPAIADAAKPAAPKAIVVEDLAGDGNALNNQGVGVVPATGTATPAQAAAFDIRSVKIVTDKAGAGATKLIMTLNLAAAPTPGGLYRILTDIGGCVFWTEYVVEADASLNASAVRFCDESATTGYTYYDATGKIEGSSIVWTIPIKQFKAQGLKVGAMLGNIGADARGSLVAVTVPSVDNLKTDKVYKVGQ